LKIEKIEPKNVTNTTTKKSRTGWLLSRKSKDKEQLKEVEELMNLPNTNTIDEDVSLEDEDEGQEHPADKLRKLENFR